MKEFVFYQDEKVSIWQRHTIYVKANTQEEAERFVRDNKLANSTDWHGDDFGGRVELVDCNKRLDPHEEITVDENDGIPTIEIQNMDMKPVADNCGNRHYLAENGGWRERAVALIKQKFGAPGEKIAEFVERWWANDMADKQNLSNFDVWFHGGDPLKSRDKKRLWVFLIPIGEFDRYATDGEIVAAFESKENADRKLPVEKITPDEFACLCNDEEFADQQYWVRFIEI